MCIRDRRRDHQGSTEFSLTDPLSSHPRVCSRLLLFWRLLTLAWAAVIYHLSTKRYGSSFSEWLLAKTLALLHITVSPATFEALNFLFRKSAHVTEYAILGLLLYGTLLNSTNFEWRLRTAVRSVLIAVLYALTDEFHQIFEPGRTASLMDFGIDTAGAFLGTLGIYRFCPESCRKRDAVFS